MILKIYIQYTIDTTIDFFLFLTVGSKLTIRPLNTKKHIATFREIKIMISQEKNVNDQKTVREEEEHN